MTFLGTILPVVGQTLLAPVNDIIDMFTPEGHTQKITKTMHYEPVFENRGGYPRKMIVPSREMTTISEEHDGVLGYLFQQGVGLIEHTEDDTTKVLDTGILATEDMVETGFNDIDDLGGKIAQDASNVLGLPLIIVAVGVAAMLYLKT